MSFWSWLRRNRRGRLSDIVYVGDGDSDSDCMTAGAAMKLSSWWSSTKLITETVATLPGGVFERSGADRVARPDHRLYELLNYAPNAEQTAVEWWEGRVAPICIDGNSYCEKRSIGDRIVALEPFREVLCRTDREPETNRLRYKTIDRGRVEYLPPEKVFHIRGFGIDGDEGLSPISYAGRSLSGATAAEKAASRLFNKGLRAAGYWKPPAVMDPEQRQQFYENYLKPGEGIEGQNKGIVVPPGFEWGNFNISPRDAELLMARNFSVADVCRWMGVPPILIGHAQEGQTMWGSGIEQIILGWLVLGLRAYLKRIEAAVNRRLVTASDREAGIFFEFNFEGLLRADSAGRASLMATLSQNGLRTRNELRKLDNMPAVDGGDDLTVQSNLVPLSQLGQQQQSSNAIRNALRSWLLEERDERKAA
jgi:HK97 family phage portal protein